MSATATRRLRLLAVLGLVLTLLGWILAPGRTCASVLLAATYVVGIGLGGLVFVAFAYLTRAGWSVALRRIPEAMAATLPLGALFMIVALAGLPLLYEWSHSDDWALQAKSAWLNVGFFLLRSVLYLAVWLLFGAAIRKVSRGQDRSGGTAATNRNTVLSAAFLVVFAITYSLACFDWIMSIEAHWFSTVFAIYNFSGLFVSALAVVTLVAIALRRSGPLASVVRPDHLHDLGRLTFGFVTFWAYLWYCQYMLIWYGNLPEETAYFVAREQGAWGPLQVLNLVLNWLVPFLVLLPRPAKRSESVLLWVAGTLLVGRWLDLGLMILPPFMPPGAPTFGLWEIGPVAAALSMVTMAIFAAFGRAEPVPRQDPLLVESLQHHT